MSPCHVPVASAVVCVWATRWSSGSGSFASSSASVSLTMTCPSLAQLYGIEKDLVLMDLLVFVMWDLVFQVPHLQAPCLAMPCASLCIAFLRDSICAE